MRCKYELGGNSVILKVVRGSSACSTNRSFVLRAAPAGLLPTMRHIGTETKHTSPRLNLGTNNTARSRVYALGAER